MTFLQWTTCQHGVDLRFAPRCYLCQPVTYLRADDRLSIPDDPEWLSQRLPVHRYCDTHPRGHQSCVDEAARLLAAMRGSA